MRKTQLLDLIIATLQADLAMAQRAAQTAHETATHEENVAENKYDTLGLEAAYLAAGQSRRVAEIGQALNTYRHLQLRPFDADAGIQLGAWVVLGDAQGGEQQFFLGPDGAGLKVRMGDVEVLVISPRAPLGHSLLGKAEGDEVSLGSGRQARTLEILRVK
ncbi:transcription elongation factor GreAB [Pseudomonas cavernae]|uniref:Transcription elongation factor GreAB n=1 Tax=Pseudomonas cavernae TaxID=2320867 RepID=A0A385YXA6_9PSED|nr:GreA/GreB family elongation factor [Pseudomonas cavernae]AYC31174.1 transcription elongation factor GreAB [Pseudomonas cavernae]